MNKTLSTKINQEKINLIYKYLNKFLVNNSNQNILYFFKTKNYSITIYQNKTILFQGENYENVLKLINYQNNFKQETKNKAIIEYGSDEVGTGDLFGGIIVCAAKIINKNEIDKLNICDSKNYSNQEIILLYNKIEKFIKIAKFELLPSEYNDLYDKYKNMNIIKTLGHYKCLNEINNNDGYAMIDQFATSDNIKKYLKIINMDWNKKYLLEIKSENRYSEVACASIVARYLFIKQIQLLSKKANFEIPFGSNNYKTKEAIKKLNNLDKKNFVKLNFKNAF